MLERMKLKASLITTAREKNLSTLRNGCPRLFCTVLHMVTPGTNVTEVMYGVLRHWLIPNGA